MKIIVPRTKNFESLCIGFQCRSMQYWNKCFGLLLVARAEHKECLFFILWLCILCSFSEFWPYEDWKLNLPVPLSVSLLYLAAIQSNWQNLRGTGVTGLRLIGGAVDSDLRSSSGLKTQVLREVPLGSKFWIQPCFFVLNCFCFCTLNRSSVHIIC